MLYFLLKRIYGGIYRNVRGREKRDNEYGFMETDVKVLKWIWNNFINDDIG